MKLSRRHFLRSSALGFAAVAVGPGLGRAAGTDPVLVSIFMRGAADGLNLVVPAGESRYFDLRPTIQVPESGLIDLDGFFGLNPALSPLVPLYQSQDLAIVHAVGNPDGTRSHFEDQDYIDRAGHVSSGWLNRHLERIGATQATAGVSLSHAVLPSLVGSTPTISLTELEDFDVNGMAREERIEALSRRYALEAGNDPVAGSVDAAFAALADVGSVVASDASLYPSSELGSALRLAASLIKADIGVRTIALDMLGWDHHKDENDRLPPLATDLGASLAAFHADLGADADRTLLIAHTEFGRKVEENGASGCEHGHGGALFALGGPVRGGRVILRDDAWPGLGPDELYEGRDLAVTTDFRDVIAEVLDRHLGSSDPGAVLPGFAVDPANYPGIL